MEMFTRWNIGVLESLVRPDVLPLFVGGWLCLLLGAGLQLLLLKKCSGAGRWGIVMFTLAAAVVCEGGLRLLGGWDGILFAVGSRLLWYPLLGAAVCTVLWCCLQRRRS